LTSASPQPPASVVSATGLSQHSLNAANINVPQALALLDGQFSSFSEAFVNEEYALWLGSAISRDRVDGLQPLLERVLEHLRSHISNDANCPNRTALNEILDLVTFSGAERQSLDFSQVVSSWGIRQKILQSLEGQYANTLNVAVGHNALDFLYWEVIDLRETYAAEAIPPDAEHLCIAILALEGVVSRVATPNWDSLIEKALIKLGGQNASFKTCVDGSETRGSSPDIILIKFHGCALKAKLDEAGYRKHIVARQPQIDSWMNETDKQAVVQEIVTTLIAKKTLMVGLSAQDANIRSIFSKAATSLPWTWPCTPPACLFAGQNVNAQQRSVLENVYPNTYSASNRQDIETQSLLPVYAKPLFISLVLKTYSHKLETFVSTIPDAILAANDKQELRKGIIYLRDFLALKAQPTNSFDFVTKLITFMNSGMSIFRVAR
jgi:hypothetical protein